MTKFRIETIGDCALYLGDCLEIMPTLDKVDAVVTDPPYGLAKKLQGGTWGKQYTDDYKFWDQKPWKPSIEFLSFAQEYIIWGGNYFTLPPSRCWLIHDKKIRGMTFADCEMAWTNFDANSRIFSHLVPNGFLKEIRYHPTEKSLEVMKWCLSFINGELILDPFLGSGTTGVACAKLGRKFIGIELEQKYFDIACKRIEEAYDQSDLFIEPPKNIVHIQDNLI